MRGAWLLAVVLASCHTPAKTEPPTPTSSTPPIAKVSVASDLLAYLPASSDLVIKFDVAALRRSALGSKHINAFVEFLAPSFAGCGYNPMAEISTIIAGVPTSGELGIFVVRGLDREKTLTCLRTSKLETRESATFDGNYVTLTNKSGAVNIFTFVDDKTLVMQGSNGPTKATLRQAIDEGVPLRATEAAAGFEAGLVEGAALSIASRPGSPGVAKIMEARLGTPATEIRATVLVTDVVAAHATVTLGSAEVARSLVDGLKPQLEQLRSFVDRYDVRAEDASLVIDAAITEAQIAFFVNLVKTAGGAAN